MTESARETAERIVREYRSHAPGSDHRPDLAELITSALSDRDAEIAKLKEAAQKVCIGQIPFCLGYLTDSTIESWRLEEANADLAALLAALG